MDDSIDLSREEEVFISVKNSSKNFPLIYTKITNRFDPTAVAD